MSLLPDTTPASVLEAIKRPLHPSRNSAQSKQATKPTEAPVTTEFHHLLDMPDMADLSTETMFVESTHTLLPLNAVPEEILETSIEASAWLALNAPTEAMPAIEPVVNTSLLTAPTMVGALDNAEVLTNPVLSTVETLSTPTLTPLESVPQATTQVVENTSVTAIYNTPITEMLASNALSVMLNPVSLPLFSLSESATAASALPLPDVHHPEFAQGIATHLTWLASQSIGQAHIQMNPPHLGALDIRLHLHNQQLQAAFFSPHHEVCQRLQESLPVLHRLLDEHGLHLANAEVSQQTPHSHTDPGASKTPVLPTVTQQNSSSDTEQANQPLAPQPYSTTSLLDTWA